MNAYLLLLFIPPLIAVFVMKYLYHEEITLGEMAAQFLLPILLITVVWGVSRYSTMHDTNFLNGEVTDKKQVRVSCSHSYSCNCVTTTTNGHSSTTCQTCYDHSNDWDWRVYTTVGKFNISRIDRRGSYEPARWTAVQAHQPVALEDSYVNYIRAAPESLFNMAAARGMYKDKLPEYPKSYDYHYADRVIPWGISVPELRLWNYSLAMMLRQVGPAKQANVVIVMTDQPESFANALKAQWIGGKKNDIVVVIGTQYPVIKWVEVFSWAKNDYANVSIRSALLGSRTLNPATTIKLIEDNIVLNYERRPMEDFKYLADEAVPSTWVLLLALILGTGLSFWLGLYFRDEDAFN